MSVVDGLIQTFAQRSGPDVQLRVFGDEYYARYETLDGFAAVDDDMLGYYCFATLDEGEYLSTGIAVTKPTPNGIDPHLIESVDVRSAKLDRRLYAALPPEAFVSGSGKPEVFGPNKGLLTGRQANTGSVRGLTILINFQDTSASITPEEVATLLNSENQKPFGNACSVREYYQLMSAGLLDYSNEVVGPITLSGKRKDYVDKLLAPEALDAVVALGVDLAQFDSRGEGVLDAVSFMYAGDTLYEGWLWPHNHFLDWRHDGYQTNFYQISSLGTRPNDLKIGTFCHESGHMLCRFPDLYDYGRRDEDNLKSAGLGVYCLMSSGNHLAGGKTPSPICAYLRYLTGWVKEEVALNAVGDYVAQHGDYGTFHIYKTSKPSEYFLVENRSRVGLDTYLPAEGLAVYHCDILGSNEWQGNSGDRHYQCGLLQADARSSLELDENTGDAGDFFANVAGDALTAATTPNSLLWDGGDSGLRVKDVSAPGAEMRFTVYVDDKANG